MASLFLTYYCPGDVRVHWLVWWERQWGIEGGDGQLGMSMGWEKWNGACAHRCNGSGSRSQPFPFGRQRGCGFRDQRRRDCGGYDVLLCDSSKLHGLHVGVVDLKELLFETVGYNRLVRRGKIVSTKGGEILVEFLQHCRL